jgi:hypothetical protein
LLRNTVDYFRTDVKDALAMFAMVPLPVRVPVPLSLPLVPKVKRPIKQRQPFDIYEDQYEQLKSIAEAERDFVNGRGMSQMVREALDLYLASQPSSKK